MQSLDIDIIPGIIQTPSCYVSQNDNLREIRLNLFSNGEAYSLSGDESLSLSIRKPSGEAKSIFVYNTGSNYVIISIDETITDLFGVCVCELRIVKNDSDIGAMNFLMKVEPNPLRR